jgi:hypothetical protein
MLLRQSLGFRNGLKRSDVLNYHCPFSFLHQYFSQNSIGQSSNFGCHFVWIPNVFSYLAVKAKQGKVVRLLN